MDKPEIDLQFLADAFEVGGPEATLRKEARHAESFVKNETLPAKMLLAPYKSQARARDEERLARETLEKWGLKFLGAVEGDPSLVRVELPAGWRKLPTYETRLVMLVDDQSRERARIVLFSEHKALIIQPRYGVKEMSHEEILYGKGAILAVVTDGRIVTGDDGVLFVTEPVQPAAQDNERRSKLERMKVPRELVKQAESWLDEHYPDWRDPLAYWD